MCALSISTAVGLAADSFAVNLLNKSDALNRFVNWITGARVNRDALAQRVWHTAMGLLRDSPMVTKSLGGRGATLAPLLTIALITGDRKETRDAIAELTRIGVDGALGTGAPGARRMLTTVLRNAASAISTGLVDSYLGAHAGEKVLATMVARHGWTPIEDRLQQALGARVGTGFLIRQIKGVLDTAVLKKAGMNQATSPEYHALADLAHIGLSGGGQDAMIARLHDYAPASFAAVRLASDGWQAARSVAKNIATRVDQARTTVNDAARMVQETVPAMVDAIQIKAGLGLQPQTLNDAYAANAHAARTAGALAVDAPPFPVGTEDRQIADAYLTQLAIARDTDPPATDRLDLPRANVPRMAEARVMQRLSEIAYASPERLKENLHLLDRLGPQQIAPLGERSDIAVVKTLTGRLSKIEANSHRWLTNDAALNRTIEDALARQPDTTTLLGGYKVARAFATQIETLPLALPANEYSYTDVAWDGGMAAVNAGWGMLGFKTGDVSAEAGARLRHLYNTCGHDKDIMQEATRHLDLLSAKSLLASTVLSRIAAPDRTPPLIDTGNGLVELAGTDPRIQFTVTRNGDRVTLSTEARWPIAAFGEARDAMRAPMGRENASAVTTGYTVTIRRLPNGGGVNVQHIAMGTAVTIANTLDFDARSGQLAVPS